MRMRTTPLYEQLKAELRLAIENGQYLPGERLPTEEELQATYHVSRNTVSHAVHELVREGLLYRVRGSGTYVRRTHRPKLPASFIQDHSYPSMAAEDRARSGDSATGPPIHISIVADVGVPLGNPYVTGILEGLTRSLTDINARAVFSGAGVQAGNLAESGALAHLESRSRQLAEEVDGLLVIAPQRDRLETLRVLERQHFPFVVVGARLDSTRYPWHNVYVDNVEAVREVVQYLWGLGHRRLAAMTGPWSSLDSADRATGFSQACEQLGLPSLTPAEVQRLDQLRPGGAENAGSPASNPPVLATKSEAGAYWLAQLADEPAWYRTVPALVQQWMALPAEQRPTAIFAGGFALALATLRALRQLGVAVPGEVSVVGFDDAISSIYLDPALTTVVQPLAQLGELGGRALAAAIRGELSGRVQRPLRAQLAVRESTGPPPPRPGKS